MLVVKDLATSNTPVLVDAKNPAGSKVIWTILAGLVGSALTYYGIEDPAIREPVMLAVQSVAGVLAIVFKAFFTTTVSTTSVPK